MLLWCHRDLTLTLWFHTLFPAFHLIRKPVVIPFASAVPETIAHTSFSIKKPSDYIIIAAANIGRQRTNTCNGKSGVWQVFIKQHWINFFKNCNATVVLEINAYLNTAEAARWPGSQGVEGDEGSSIQLSVPSHHIISNGSVNQLVTSSSVRPCTNVVIRNRICECKV